MKIVEYDHSLHSDTLKCFLLARNMHSHAVSLSLNKLHLPKIGYMVSDDNDDPIAFGFLRLIEGNVGTLDSYISHPDKDPKVRNSCLDLLTATLLGKSKELKLHKVLIFSADTNTQKRATKFGAVTDKDTILQSIILV